MYLFEIFGLELDIQPLFDELKAWWDGLLALLPNLILALIVICLGYIVTRFTKKYFDRLANRLVNDRTIANLISTTLTVLLILFFIIVTLNVLELTGVVSSILAGAGVVGLALGLAFQDPILNFFSGIILSIRNLFRPGDLIEVDGYRGIVDRVTLRHTTLHTLQGQDIMIPNKIVAQNPLMNYDKLGRRRVDLACGVSYGENLQEVKELTIKAIKENVAHDDSKDVQLFYNEFGGSSINYTLRFWLKDQKTGQSDFLAAQSDAIVAIKTAYDANDIMIPFPIRTLDFGIKGGEKLNEMLGGDAGTKATDERQEAVEN